MTQMHVAALQQSFSDDIDTNIDSVEALVREAAGFALARWPQAAREQEEKAAANAAAARSDFDSKK